MKKSFLMLFFFLGALLLCTPETASAQNEKADYAVEVNGSALSKPGKLLGIYSVQEGTTDYLNVSCIRFYWEEENGENTYLDFHPLQVQLLFGDAAMQGIESIQIFDGGNVQDHMSLDGLPSGTLVSVYNTSGRLCFSIRIGEGQNVVDTSALPRGIYVAKAGKIVFKFNKK